MTEVNEEGGNCFLQSINEEEEFFRGGWKKLRKQQSSLLIC